MIRQKFTKVTRDRLRQEIWDYLTKRNLIKWNGHNVYVHSSLANEIIRAYDRIYFNGNLFKYLGTGQSIGTMIQSKRSAAGTIFYKAAFTGPGTITDICLNSYTFFSAWDDRDAGIYMVNGILPRDRVEAMMLVTEHELIHAIHIRQSGRSSHSNGFKYLANKIFGHTEYKHRIGVSIEKLKNWEEMNKQAAQAKSRIRIGDVIKFTDLVGKEYHGRVIKKNRVRARVRIVNGDAKFRDGILVTVPYNLIDLT